MRFSIAIVVLVLFAGPAAAADAESAIDRVASLRLALDRIEEAERAVNKQKAALGSHLDALAAEIERQKASRGARWLPDLELEQKLRQSQELSDALTLLNREITALQQARTARLRELLQAYDALIEQLAGPLRGGRGLSNTQLALLKQAREEREALWARVSPKATTPRRLDPESLLASDDPEELRDRRDTVRDEQDRLRHELASLDKGLEQLAQDERLQQEMQDFLEEQEMFDERSRLLRLNPGPASGDATSTDNPADPSPGPPGELGGGGAPAPAPSVGVFPVGLSPEAGPAVDRLPARDELRQRRSRVVEELKKLQILSDRLLEKIDSLTSAPHP